jgi:hypothetical protein
MLLCSIFGHFKLDKEVQDAYAKRMPVDYVVWKHRVVPFLRQVLPTLQLTARYETAAWLQIGEVTALTQELILKFLLYHRNYDTIEISRIVENWRKEYGANGGTSDRYH